MVTLVVSGGIFAIASEVSSSNGSIRFDSNDDGVSEMKLNATGLAIGSNLSPSANLTVQGNGILNTLTVGSAIGNSSNLHISGSLGFSFETVSSNTTIGGSSFVFADSSAGNITVTLPDPSTTSGRVYTIKKTSYSNQVSIVGAIDLPITYSLLDNSVGAMTMISDGSNWMTKDIYGSYSTGSRGVQFEISGDSFGLRTNFTGSMDIYWGDSSVDKNVAVTGDTTTDHTYSQAGVYTISVITTDDFRFYMNNDATNRAKLLKVTGTLVNTWSNIFEKAFHGCSALTEINVANFPAEGGGFAAVFRDCSSLISIPAIDTSNVTTFNGAWRGCTSITTIPSSYDFSKATNMFGAWWDCTSITSFPAINSANCTTLQSTFRDCNSLLTAPTLDTGKVQKFQNTWENCSSLTSFPVINSANVTNASGFQQCWQGCTNLATFPGNVFDNCPATNFSNAFTNCALSAQSIENILVSIDAAGQSNGTLGLSGGTNAAESTWTVSANTAKSNLVGKGWSIATNP